MMRNKALIIALSLILGLAVGGLIGGYFKNRSPAEENEPVAEDIGKAAEKADLIRVETPRPNQKITSPLTILGEARGTWFFEASFPVKLLDENGNLLAQIPAQAQGEWMTENFVPFTAKLEFPKPNTAKGLLILEKDNPSGLPQNADQLEIPVDFND